MALTIRKLRAGLVVAAVVLLAVIAGYLGMARRRMTNYLHDIAEKNGLDISNEGVSFSHTFGANTQFKLHAAKQITYQNGKMTLRDVGIELYGAKSNRSDHIHGSEFEYDPKNGVLVGKGDVYIDLAAPASDADKGPLKDKALPPKPQGEDDSKIIHVKTSGVTFSEKAGSATTDQRVDFIAGGMTGNSVGASYDSKSGAIVLRSAVHLSGLRNDRPTVVTASWAEMDRIGDLVKLAGAKALLQTDDGARTVAADHSVIHMQDGNPRRIDGEGHVVLTGDGHDASHGVATGDRMQMDLNAAGQPQAGYLAGNVKFTNEAPNRKEDGHSQDVHVAFDAVGRPVHSVLTGDVEMNVHEATAHRRLNAAKVDLDLGGGGKAPMFVKGAVATGPDGAQLRLVDKSGKDKQLNNASAVRADVLVARFGPEGSQPAGKAKKVKNGIGPPLEGLDGKGRTYVEQIVTDDKGALQSKQSSTGETLKVDFRTQDDGKIEVTRTEQRGGVTMLREVAQKPSANKPGAAKPTAAPASAKSSASKTDPEVEHAKANVAGTCRFRV
jgi:lipopolysaccharide export system protein LptA